MHLSAVDPESYLQWVSPGLHNRLQECIDSCFRPRRMGENASFLGRKVPR